MRSEQLSAFCTYGKERLGAAEEMLKAAAVMASAMQAYGASTQLMVGVLPAGTSLPTMAMGRIGEFGGALGNLELLLAAEFWRLGAGVEAVPRTAFFHPIRQATDTRQHRPHKNATCL